MSISFGNNFIAVSQTWTQLKSTLGNKPMSLQYDDSDTGAYQLFALDGPVVYVTTIYRGTVPDSVVNGGYTQAQNDQDKSDFEANFKGRANQPIVPFQAGDSRWIFRLGNMTTSGSQELLVSNNGYFEPQSQGQRGVKSTSASDVNPGGSGAKAVRITFLNSNYQRKIEELNLNGVTTVPTVNTDIRFIEKFEVIKGTAAAGKITLCTGSNGLGEICSIGVATTDAFLCHHYVPSGSQAEVIEWDVSVSDDALMRLKGQQWVSGNLVDPVIFDLENLTGIASGSLLNSTRTFKTMPVQEKTRVYVTAQSQQGTATTIRSRLNIWEDALYVSGSS